MSSYSRTAQLVVWGGLAMVIAGIIGAYVQSRIYQRERVQSSAADEDKPLLVYSQLSDFNLTNQFGRAVTLADLKGQIWMADIIFTRCPGPCAAMTRRMVELQNALPPDSPLKLVSLTTDPEYDLPPILREYADKFGANSNRWTFLTGTKSEIRKLAVGGLKLVSLDKRPEERESADDLFIHSTIFVLVDGQGRLRATFEGDQPDARQKMLKTVEKLLREKTP